MTRHTFDDLGAIYLWSGGYAMNFGQNGFGVKRCCSGHHTPAEAKTHGLGRLSELAAELADRDVALWVVNTPEGVA